MTKQELQKARFAGFLKVAVFMIGCDGSLWLTGLSLRQNNFTTGHQAVKFFHFLHPTGDTALLESSPARIIG